MRIRAVLASNMIAGIAFAAIGAALFHAAGMPLALILGAMAGSAAYGNLVAPLPDTKLLRRAGQLIVGIAVAAGPTEEVFAELSGLLPVMICAAVVANLAGGALAVPLAIVARIDRTTALLSSLPAGMAEMATLADDLGGNPQVVSVVHTLRVILVVVSIPFIVGISGEGIPPIPHSSEGQWPTLLFVVLLGGGGAYIASRAGVLNPWLILPMITGIGVVLAGVTIPPLPRPFLAAAQILIGLSLGARFHLADLASVPRVAMAALLSSGILIALMVLALVPLLHAITDVEHAVLILAVAPGGLGEMIASAKVLGLGAATVAGFQLIRSLTTNMLAPLLIRRWAIRGR